MRITPRPPRIEYELEIVLSVLSLADTRTIKISIKTRLCEPTTYTVMMRKTADNFEGLALAAPTFDAKTLDVFDLLTGVTISGKPRYATSQWTPGLSTAPMRQEQLRELAPGKAYTSECELSGEGGQMEWFLKSFRIDDFSAILNRKLGIRLRTVQMFWAAKRTDELFGDAETFRRHYWCISLMTKSPAVAAFSVLQ